MRRFLVISGINGDPEALLRLQTVVRDKRPDGLLFAGGILNYDGVNATKSGVANTHSKEGPFFVEQFFSTLGSLGIFCAVIPGVFDAPLDLFLRIGMAAELEYSKIHLVHVTPVEEGETGVFGLGACITDNTSTDIGYYSRTLAEYYLRPMQTATQPRKVLLLSDLPESWHSDLENRRVADAFITTYHPSVCVVGGQVAQGRIERIARTTLIHPGHFSVGSAAWIDFGTTGDDQAQLLNLRESTKSRECVVLNS